MKRCIRVMALCMLVAFIAVGCGGKDTVRQYKQLNLAADLRLAVLQGAGEYSKLGIIDEATKEKIILIDRHIAAAGKVATARLKEIVLLERLEAMTPGTVTPEQLRAAAQAYANAKTNLRSRWAELVVVVDPWLMEWIQKASAK
jgi:hypothetical protein